jgi:hypothetical protein
MIPCLIGVDSDRPGVYGEVLVLGYQSNDVPKAERVVPVGLRPVTAGDGMQQGYWYHGPLHATRPPDRSEGLVCWTVGGALTAF